MMNTRQLARWLRREIHGVDIPSRKCPRSRRFRVGPARNWKYRAWVRSLPCASCGLDPAGEAAHTGKDGGMRQKASDYSCIPLCSNCHSFRSGAYHREGRKDFEARFGVNVEETVKRLNWLWFNQGRDAA
ncbi:MAG: DUF968 domain-containing protein [Patescibacteria group bacterium]|nr:DUF968 domain-containing protein [Patescibacteria group bacterium]